MQVDVKRIQAAISRVEEQLGKMAQHASLGMKILQHIVSELNIELGRPEMGAVEGNKERKDVEHKEPVGRQTAKEVEGKAGARSRRKSKLTKQSSSKN